MSNWEWESFGRFLNDKFIHHSKRWPASCSSSEFFHHPKRKAMLRDVLLRADDGGFPDLGMALGYESCIS